MLYGMFSFSVRASEIFRPIGYCIPQVRELQVSQEFTPLDRFLGYEEVQPLPRRFVAKSQSRVARPTRGGAQDRGVLEKYVEGLSDEPVGLATLAVARLAAAADLRFRPIRHALLKRVTLANMIAAKGRARPKSNCTMSSAPSWL